MSLADTLAIARVLAVIPIVWAIATQHRDHAPTRPTTARRLVWAARHQPVVAGRSVANA